MSGEKKSYLHRKLTVSIFWAALLFAAITSSASFFIELARVAEKSRIMLGELLDTVESTAAIAAYSGNRSIGEDVLKGLLRNRTVQSARLVSDQGLELHQTREGALQAREEVSRTLRSPFGDRESVGVLAITPDAGYILQEAHHGFLTSVINSTFVIGLTALISWLLVRITLSRPLMKVSDTLQAIMTGKGDRLERLPLHRHDELGLLVENINALLEMNRQKFEEERRLLRQIQAVERQLRTIFEHTSAGIFILDKDGRLKTANPTLGRVIGLSDEAEHSMVGQDFAALAFATAESFRGLMSQAMNEGMMVAADLQLGKLSSSAAWVHCLLSHHAASENGAFFEGVVYDITDRRALELQIRHEADHDPLTGLHRRQALERNLERLLKSTPTAGASHVFMLLDLDNFKSINDTYGHAAGDIVLFETARRLKAHVRGGDMVARLGGDEFAVVLVDCVPLERARAIAAQIVADVIRPITIGPGLAGQVGISIGIAVHSESFQTLDKLFEAADRAMYEVKHRGRNGYATIGPEGVIKVEKPA